MILLDGTRSHIEVNLFLLDICGCLLLIERGVCRVRRRIVKSGLRQLEVSIDPCWKHTMRLRSEPSLELGLRT